MLINKVTAAYYAVVLSGILMVTTFAYSVILVPTWNFIATLPGIVKNATSGLLTASPTPIPPPKPSTTNRQTPVPTPPPPAPVIAAGREPTPANCGRIIKQIKSGNYVPVPAECEPAYQVFKEQEQTALQGQKQREEAHQRELDRAGRDKENEQKAELERQRSDERQRNDEQQRQAAEQNRTAAFERERRQQEAEERRRQEARDDAARREAKQAAEQREAQRRREQQQRNDALIKFGSDLKRVFKKNR